jgi:hypothetical protein
MIQQQIAILASHTVQRGASLASLRTAKAWPDTTSSAPTIEVVTELFSAHSQAKISDLPDQTDDSSIDNSCGRSIRREGVPSSALPLQAHS